MRVLVFLVLASLLACSVDDRDSGRLSATEEIRMVPSELDDVAEFMKKHKRKFVGLGIGIVGVPIVLNLSKKFLVFSNPMVEAGYVGYIYKEPVRFSATKGGFHKTVVGPARLGLHLSPNEYKVIPIDIRYKTYSERFKILAADQLNIEFMAHVRLRAKRDENSIRQIVEVYGGTNWYQSNIKEPIRTKVRKAVQIYKSTEVKENRAKIEAAVLADLKSFLAAKPFEADTISVGNIDYPDVVERAVERKLAAKQQLEEQLIQKDIAREKAAIKVIEAEGQAKAQEIVKKSLTSLYIQHEAIKALEALSNSPNKVFIYIPTGNMAVPLVKTVDEKN
ncbi:MAG: SPFH domain-containing protein [Pseudomonadota bacterium]|nr:SPFH domain-containing protein [Pseudomonadota bacterium]